MNATCAARHAEGETCGNCCDHQSDYGCTECAAANARKAFWTEIDFEKLRERVLRDEAWTEVDLEKLRDALRTHRQPLRI